MYTKYFALQIVSLLISSILFSSEHKEAKELCTEVKCMHCHNTNDFQTRKNGVNSFAKLHKSVQACARNTNAGWFEEGTITMSAVISTTNIMISNSCQSLKSSSYYFIFTTIMLRLPFFSSIFISKYLSSSLKISPQLL